MQKIQYIAVASSSSDVIKLKQLEKGCGKNFKVIATTLEARKALVKTRLPFAELDIPVNEKTMRILQVQAKVLIDNLINDSRIIKTFSVDEVNILEFLTNRFHTFLYRMILGFLNVQQIKMASGNVNLILFKKNIITDHDSPFNSNYNSLAFYLWAKYHPVFTLKLITDYNAKNQGGFNVTVIKTTNAILNYLHYVKEKHSKHTRQIIFVLPAFHAVKLISLFKNLEKNNIHYLVLVHNLGIKERVELVKNSIRFMPRDSLKDKSLINKSYDISLEIKRRWKQESNTFELLRQNNKISKFLTIAAFYRIEQFLKSELVQTINDRLIAKRFFKEYKPEIVVTTTDPDAKVLPFIIEAKSNKINTITIQHGAYVYAAGVDFKSDKIMVWGRYYKSWFMRNLNKNDAQIFITGSPFFDNIKLIPFKKSFITNRKEHSILILLSDIVTLSVEKELVILNKKLTKLGINYIYIRPHPWQKITGINFNRKLWLGDKIILANDKDLDYYLDKSQIVVTTNTTAGFNALIKGKPLIYWHLKGVEYLPFEKAGIPVATNADQIINSVREIKNGRYQFLNKKRQQLIEEVFYKLDGHASQRIANFLVSELR